jgi:hypothetical protein
MISWYQIKEYNFSLLLFALSYSMFENVITFGDSRIVEGYLVIPAQCL